MLLLRVLMLVLTLAVVQLKLLVRNQLRSGLELRRMNRLPFPLLSPLGICVRLSQGLSCSMYGSQLRGMLTLVKLVWNQ
jgi:hypothetical protein